MRISSKLKNVCSWRSYVSGIFLVSVSLILTGCGTTKVAMEVQRPPNLNTTGIQRIAVMSFEFPESCNDPICQQAAQYAANVVVNKIQATNRFTLVKPAIINNAETKGENIESYVDAIFKGNITKMEGGVSSQPFPCKKDPPVCYRFYDEVYVELTYSFVRTRDGATVGPIAKKGGSKADAGKMSKSELVMKAIENSFIDLHQDVAPYTITIQRSMEDEPDKNLKPQMEAALTHYTKNRDIVAARKAYLAIWESHQSVAAAVNASILYEAMGEIQNAADLMQQVFTATRNPIAKNVLTRLNEELKKKAEVEQFSGSQNPTKEKEETLPTNEENNEE